MRTVDEEIARRDERSLYSSRISAREIRIAPTRRRTAPEELCGSLSFYEAVALSPRAEEPNFDAHSRTASTRARARARHCSTEIKETRDTRRLARRERFRLSLARSFPPDHLAFL